MMACHFISGEETFDRDNLSKKSEKKFEKDWRFWLPLWTCVIVETASWIWALILMSDEVKFDTFYLSDRIKPKTWPQYIIFGFILGFFTSISSTAAHELIHKREWFNKLIGTWVYQKYFYSHFLDEHILGHHRMVATLEDSASSRKNESIWAFIVRECFVGNVNSWKREFKRIRKVKGEDASWFSLIAYNKMTIYQMMNISMLLIIYTQLGIASLKFQFVYFLSSVFFLNLANYFEHYGLQRKKDKNGVYESITRYHSWNHVSSALYFRLQRHSDHHTASFRPY